MDKCPEGFEDELKCFIDEVEGEVNTIKDFMAISSLSDIARVDEANDMLIDLAEGLY